MFKLLKDLTRPPESLSTERSPTAASAGDPSPASPSATTFGGGSAGGGGVTTRSRSGSYISRSRSGSNANAMPPSPMDAALLSATSAFFNMNLEDESDSGDEDAGDDTDRCAIQLTGLLHALQDVSGTMYLVETFSELLSVQGTPASWRAFRDNRGFDRILDCLGELAWKDKPADVDEEQWQVEEVQRAEAQRLCLEVLGWATEDRAGARVFNESYGYASLLEPLRALSKRETGDTLPDSRVLGLLLAHLLGNNYALLSLFSGDLDALLSDDSTLESKLSDIGLRWAEGLPLLWAYLWGLESADSDNLWPDRLLAGELETAGGTQGKLIRITLKILLLATRHVSDLFLIRTYLPSLPDFLLTRIYGWEQPRPVQTTFPPREEWFQNAEAEEIPPRPEWIEPSADLRATYFELLRNLLKGGVNPGQAWRLFALVRNLPEEKQEETPESTAVSTPASEDAGGGAQKRKKSLLKLTVPTLPLATKAGETLNLEILGLIKTLMPVRTPDTFVFRGGKDDVEGGLEIKDLCHAWPSSTRGFIFACWVHIKHLNDAITLLHLSQKDSPYPLLQIRILENSQIGLSSYVEGQEGAPEEVVCGAIEALVPHGEWVHFAVGCRKGRSTLGGGGEARIFINGKRVGAVRLAYPVPKQESNRSQRYNHHHHNPRAPPPPTIRASVGRAWKVDGAKRSEGAHGLDHGSNEWLLGRTMLLDEVISEEVVMLMYHLGSHYHGNFQDALNKFLTYDGATAIHLFLYGISQASSQKALTLLPANSALVRAIRVGPAIPEENFMFSVCAKDMIDPDHVLNAAVPHALRASDFIYARARLVGSVFPFSTDDLDLSVASVGGGVVILKVIDLAQDSEQLATTLTILRDMIQYSWSASEEMERIHGFDLLAAILRPKMPSMVDTTCARILLSILGISEDSPESATVHNSAAYRAIGLEFELWATASLEVQTIYFDHFSLLLSKSQFKRYNMLRTFQKSNVVRKLLFAIRQNMYDADTLELAVATLKLNLAARWSAEDAIKPVFAFLVSSLCQNNGVVTSSEPTPAQLPGAMILQMMAELLHNPKRLVKLNKALSLHRLLVVFLESNPAPFVALPCLDILATCLATPGLESFQRYFEAEGGFVLLAKTLAPIWSASVQETVFRMTFGPTGTAAASLACPHTIPTLLTALDVLLQATAEAGGQNSATSESSPLAREVPLSPMEEAPKEVYDDDRLDNLLNKLAEVYRQSSAFRRAINVKRIETMLPNLVDFAALSSSGMKNIRPERAESQRAAAVNWLSALIDLSKAPATIITQMKLLVEQLKASMTDPPPPAFAPSPLARTSALNSPLHSLLPPALSPSSPRRRPSTDLQRARLGMDRPMPTLRRTLTGESILKEEHDKNAAWRMIILSTDAQKHAAMALDRKEHWHRLSQVDWPAKVAAMRGENGVWADRNAKVIWRMDGSEGPLRMRSRLERVDHVHRDGRAKASRQRDAIPSTDELSSAVSRVNQMPWEDPFALALTDTPIDEESQASPSSPRADQPPATPAEDGSEDESFAEIDEYSNKMRLVAKALQAGDVVEEAYNIVRIVGVDALPGLLILGSRNLYLIDGLVKTPDGKVVEADQAPRDVLSIPSGTLADFDPSDQRSHRWPYADVVESNKRAFLFRDVALELYFSDKQNFLVVFQDKKQRQAVVQKVQAKVEGRDALARSVIGSFVLDTVARVTRGDQLEDMTRRWQNREISNFAYLQMLNQHAGRTPNDVTQYPVFPWVLSDYTSQILDLTNPASFRNLALPMGALTESRKEAAVERYQATEGVGETPFHYGTHYSSSMIVCGYMIRVSPFTEIFIALQGGTFDLADRLFSSIPRAWDSASHTNRGDVRELIPEFYYSPMFLVNINHHNFGKKQVSGETVDDVALPPWALNDPMLFVHWNREALESDYVSRHLPEWIDLTFGYKQRDPASYNCFHPLSYRGAVDLDKMKDAAEKAASTSIIHNFGQTPPQIFRNPHPQRFLGGNRSSLPVGTRFGVAEHWQLLLRSALPITETTTRIHHILDPLSSDAKPPVQQQFRLVVPGHPLLSVQYGFADLSLRLYFQDNVHRLIHIVEGIEVAHAAFASATLLVTVSTLGIITAWRLSVKGSGFRRGDATLVREATLCGARDVTCIAVSTPWSLLVTGSADGTAMVWDMNGLTYIRTLQTPRKDPIQFMAVNDANGHIALASDRHLYMFSLNGHPIAATSIEGGRLRLPVLKFDHELGEPVTPPKYTGGISFLKREFLRWGDLFVVGIGTEVALYRCVPGVRRFPDQDVEPWRLVKQGILHGSDTHNEGDVTAVRFIGETLYVGFEPIERRGKHVLYQWSLPDSNARHVPDSVSNCMAAGCNARFGLLEPRRHCGGCGGAFCGSHALHVENFGARYCPSCLAVLAEGNSLGLLHSRAGSAQASRAASRRGSIVLESAPVNATSGHATPPVRGHSPRTSTATAASPSANLSPKSASASGQASGSASPAV